jgi:hypothetical protein
LGNLPGLERASGMVIEFSVTGVRVAEGIEL